MANRKIAVLIDSENTPYSKLNHVIDELSSFGQIVVKRAYGDFSSEQLKNWKKPLNELAIQAKQQFAYTSGKNSTDALMIIDAMDLLYSGKLDGFCIVSSDSDFTRLAIRLRESGMKVIGIGEQKTPKPFISACDRFIFIEVLEGAKKKKTTAASTDKKKDEKIMTKIDVETIDIIESSIEDIADDDGWAFLGDVGNLIVKKKPEFDPRNFGFSKLTPLMKSLTHLLEIHERESDKKGIKHVYVRLK